MVLEDESQHLHEQNHQVLEVNILSMEYMGDGSLLFTYIELPQTQTSWDRLLTQQCKTIKRRRSLT